MFIIKNNAATEVVPQTFAGLGFREKEHLQEWIANNPTMLGEELLIIQKEFAGFDETRERLDLLALDTHGNLVVIENKRDDSGADVTWQALKYVSYCSTFTAEGIVRVFQEYLKKLGTGKNAETELREFFEQGDFSSILEQGDQRVILVAANFRREVTSTVMWLFNRGIDIKCIKVTPYKHGEDILIDPEQIIPVKDAEDYLIQLAEKRQAQTIATAEARERQRNFSFSEIGIQPGEELVFVKNETKTCKVFDDKKVEYEGEAKPLSLSALALKLLKEEGIDRPSGSAQGGREFSYKGELLTDIRKKLGK